ncbi:hypothetical protein Tco_0300591 [Tanacetum coccineum]
MWGVGRLDMGNGIGGHEWGGLPDGVEVGLGEGDGSGVGSYREEYWEGGVCGKLGVVDVEKKGWGGLCLWMSGMGDGGSTKRGGPREEEQIFLDDLARLQRQEKEANEEAESSSQEYLENRKTENSVLLRWQEFEKKEERRGNGRRRRKEEAEERKKKEEKEKKKRKRKLLKIEKLGLIAMQEEFVASFFEIQKVWILVDFTYGKKGYPVPKSGWPKEEDIDLCEVFAPVARLEAIRIFYHLHRLWALYSISYEIVEKLLFLYGKLMKSLCMGCIKLPEHEVLVDEDKEIDEVRLSTEDGVSTDKEGVSTDFEKVSTDFEKVSTDRPIVSTDGSKVSTDEQIEGTDEQVEGTEEHNEGTEEIFESTEEQREGTEEKVESTAGQIKGTEDQTKEEIATQASQTSTQTPTSMIFGDDETIATLLLNMSQAKAASKEKEKGVELKDVEEIDRPRPTSTRSLLTLKPLPKIDPKDKGKKKIEEEDESESEDDDIPQAVKKFKQLESDEEMARKIQEEWEAEEERNKIAEEEATDESLIKNFDDIKARIEADRILAEKLQEQEREQFTIEERAKFLHDTIAAQRKFLAQQRSEAIRNRPPTKNQLRNQMMTYLKHVGNFKHSELKSKKFEDIQAMYEKIKRSDEDFIAIGSVEDDRLIKRMNKKDSSKGEEIKQESKEEVKEEDKGEENTRKRKHGTRKKMKSRKRRFKQDTSQDDPSDIEKENDELRLCLTIAPDEDKEVDYEILDKKYPIIDWKTENLGTKPQFDESKRLEEINMNVVTRSNGQKRYFSTLIRVLSVFDREDLDAIYKLVMDIYQDKIPEGFDKVLWGDLIVMFNPDEQDEFWNSQHEWE